MTRTLLPLLLLAGCDLVFIDPDGTGVLAAPRAGTHEGPERLAIRNATGAPIRCEVWEDDDCPSLGDSLAELERLEPRTTWSVRNVECTIVDIACFEVDATDRDLPLRAWTWFVEPPDIEEDDE